MRIGWLNEYSVIALLGLLSSRGINKRFFRGHWCSDQIIPLEFEVVLVTARNGMARKVTW
jgi:hypothetical protein